MNVKTFIQSKTYKIIILSLAALVILFLAFNAGMAVGFRKARFSYQWAENYHKNFAGPRGGMLRGAFRDFGGEDFIGAHGAAGQIIKIDGNEIVIRGRDGIEKIAVVKDDTDIERLREAVKLADLKVDDYIAVIGSPDDAGRIEAKLIRVLPAATSMMPFLPMMPGRMMR